MNEELLGQNVLVYSPKDEMQLVRREVNLLHEQMFHDQFSPHRYAVFFLPGDYLDAGLMRVPYYMQIAGLGRTPYEVQFPTYIRQHPCAMTTAPVLSGAQQKTYPS